MQTKPAGRGGGSKWLWIALGIIALVILAIVLIQLFNAEESAGPEAGATISEISQAPDEYIGQTVTVSGEVAEVIGPQTFSIGAQDEAGGGTLLVVGAQPLAEIVAEDEEIAAEDVVGVSGTVREFDIPAIEEEIGADLDDAALAEFEGNPAIVANNVDPTP